MDLQSKQYPVTDVAAAQELFVQRGWSDGLPVVPPTPDLVEAFLCAAGVEPDDVVATLPEQARELTAEKIAINAIAAGCRAEYLSLVLAAVRAMAEPAFNLHTTTISGATAPLIVVSGPVVDQLAMNSSFSLFGPGNQPNATIGRAIRLVLQNLCGGVPGVLDNATFGHPGKYSYCIAESPTMSPWGPMHVDRGVDAASSGVTVFAGEGPINARNDWADEPGPVLATIADAMKVSHFTGGSFTIVVGPLHARILARAGLTRADVRAELCSRSVRSVDDLERAGRRPGPPVPGFSDDERPAVREPDDLVVLVAGGTLYGYSAVVPYWVGGPESRPVTLGLTADESARCSIRLH